MPRFRVRVSANVLVESVLDLEAPDEETACANAAALAADFYLYDWEVLEEPDPEYIDAEIVEDEKTRNHV